MYQSGRRDNRGVDSSGPDPGGARPARRDESSAPCSRTMGRARRCGTRHGIGTGSLRRADSSRLHIARTLQSNPMAPASVQAHRGVITTPRSSTFVSSLPAVVPIRRGFRHWGNRPGVGVQKLSCRHRGDPLTADAPTAHKSPPAVALPFISYVRNTTFTRRATRHAFPIVALMAVDGIGVG